jgi:hypothetical protein
MDFEELLNPLTVELAETTVLATGMFDGRDVGGHGPTELEFVIGSESNVNNRSLFFSFSEHCRKVKAIKNTIGSRLIYVYV